MEETELQHRLTRLAERTAPPPRESLARTVVATHRARRRQTVGLTSLVAAVAALVVVSATTLGGQPDAELISGSAAVDGGWAADLLAAPTRGSLAADAEFVEGIRQLSWRSPRGGPYDAGADSSASTRHVLYAGEVGGSRFALVSGAATSSEPDAGPALAWFLGPAGAGPEAMVLQSAPRGVDAYGGPAGFLEQATGALVVVGAPGDEFSLSLRPVVSAQGSVQRDYAPLAGPDGVVETVVPAGARSGQSLRYQVVRQTETWISVPDVSGTDSSPPVLPVTWLRPPPPASPADGLAQEDPQRLLDQLGLTPDDARFTMIWAGDVPSPTPRPSRVGLLAATLPSGAVYLQCSIGLAFDDGSAGGTWCGSEIRPAGASLAEQTFVVRADATEMSEHSAVVSTLVVVAPPAATSARAVDLDGVVLAEFPLTDGVATVPFPERTATVETLAADGTMLASTRAMTMADLGD